MRDEEQRGAVADLHARDQLQDLLLDGDIQRRGGFVGDDQLRLGGKRRCDQDALAHSSRQFMRIGSQHPVRIGDLHLGQQFARAGVGIGAGPAQDIDQPVGDLRPDPVAGVQRGQRVLRDQRGRCANPFAPQGRGQLQKVHPVEQDFSRSDFDRGRQDTEDGLADHRLPRAGLSHQTAHLSGCDIQRNAPEERRAFFQTHGQVADGQEAHRSTGWKRSFSPSPSWEKERTVRNRVISGKTSTHQA